MIHQRLGLIAATAITLAGAVFELRDVEAFGVVTNHYNSNTNAQVVSRSSSTSTTSLFAGSEVFMPALSSTMKEGKVVSWLKSEGDEIEAGEAIMVVESDKADMDVEAFEDGFLAKILVNEGEMAPVGDCVALIAATAEEIDSVVAAAGDGSAAAAPPAAAEAATATSGGAVSAPDCEFSQIDMPALSSTMKEGKVVSWLKAEGDAIESGEAIMVVESDKADMDVEAFDDGFLAAILTEEGDTSLVGAPVALIAAEEKDIPALQAYAASLSGGAPPAAAAAPAAATAAAPKASSAPAA
ncbi:MAG: pyruvate dehydrogenase E2 component (dihydrolipoamide acetyltransferase), partial [Bacillariaceae sp.]